MLALTRSPPRTLPENDDVPITVPNNPNALALSLCGKVTCMIASTCGNSSASRNALQCAGCDQEIPETAQSPHNIDAAVKAVTPHINIRFRP